MTDPIGHVPVDDRCKACGLKPDPDDVFPHEPCADQKRAWALVTEGYLALPESPEAFLAVVVEAAKRGMQP